MDDGDKRRSHFARTRADTPRDLSVVFSKKLNLNEQEQDESESPEHQLEEGEQLEEEEEEDDDTSLQHFQAQQAEPLSLGQNHHLTHHRDYEYQDYQHQQHYQDEYDDDEDHHYHEDQYQGYHDQQQYHEHDDVHEVHRDQCLARLLEVEDFLTELLLGKPSLVQLLREPDVIKELITFSLGMPHVHSDQEQDEDFEVRLHRIDRRADVAFQTLSSDFVLEVVITDEELLDHVFSFLDYPSGKKESNHFSRIVMVFLDRYSHELMMYLRSRDGIVFKMVQNIEDQTIVDLLYKFVDAGITHQWLYEENLFKLLLDGLNDSKKVSAHRRACFAQVISDVLHFCCRWVSNSMLVSEVMENESLTLILLEYTLSPGEDRSERLKEGLIIFSIMLQLLSSEAVQEEPPFIRLLCENIPLFISLLKIVPPHEEGEGKAETGKENKEGEDKKEGADEKEEEEEKGEGETSQEQSDLAKSFAAEIGGFFSLETSAGSLCPTLGTLRLQVADFFCALLYCGFPVLQTYSSKFMELFPLAVDLLFFYKWNNIFHNVLSRILAAVFECPDEEMIVRVLDQTQLLKRLVAAFYDETPTGNKGHLLQLCQECLRCAQVSPLVADYTYNYPMWDEFVQTRLDELLSEQDPPMEGDQDDGYIGYDEIGEQRWMEGEQHGYADADQQEYYDDPGL